MHIPSCLPFYQGLVERVLSMCDAGDKRDATLLLRLATLTPLNGPPEPLLEAMQEMAASTVDVMDHVRFNAAVAILHNWMHDVRVAQTLQEWFAHPEKHFSPMGPMAGVIVYERLNQVAGQPNRRALLASEFEKKLWDRGVRRALTFSSQPDKTWEKAPSVGFATTLNEALWLMFSGRKIDFGTW